MVNCCTHLLRSSSPFVSVVNSYSKLLRNHMTPTSTVVRLFQERHLTKGIPFVRALQLGILVGVLSCGTDGPSGPDLATQRALARIEVLSGDGQRVGPAEKVPLSPRLKAWSDRGRPLVGAVLRLSPDQGRGAIADTSVTTDAAGEASISGWRAPLDAGAFGLGVSSTPRVATETVVTARLTATVVDSARTAATGTVSAAASVITVTDMNSPLSGLRIEIPAGAYAESHQVTVAAKPMPASVPRSANATLVAPLISISGLAGTDSLLRIRLPRAVNAAGVLFAFTLASDGTRQPLTVLASDSATITVQIRPGQVSSARMTNLLSFSSAVAPIDQNFVLSTITLRTSGVVATGFKPGVDDPAFVNGGSAWASRGYCAGWSILAGWHFKGSSGQTARQAFPALGSFASNTYYSSQLNPAIRLATRMHRFSGHVADNAGQVDKDQYGQIIANIDYLTVPVLVGMSTPDEDAGHEVLAYKVDLDAGRVYIANPNLPGNTEQWITYDKSTEHFQPYVERACVNCGAGATYSHIATRAGKFNEIWNDLVADGQQYATDGLKSVYPPIGLRISGTGVPDQALVGNSTTLSVEASVQSVKVSLPSSGADVLYLVSEQWDPASAAIKLLTGDFGHSIDVRLKPGQNQVPLIVYKNETHFFRPDEVGWADARMLTVTRKLPLLKVLSSPATAMAGAPMATVRVALVDGTGATVTDDPRSVTIALGPNTSGAVLTGTRTVTTANGIADFSNLIIDRTGRYTLVATSTGLASAGSDPLDVIAVARITLSPSSANLQVGDATQVTASALDASGTVISGQSFSWTSSAPSIASVAAGRVSALAAGTATITAAIGTISGTMTVNVTGPPQNTGSFTGRVYNAVSGTGLSGVTVDVKIGSSLVTRVSSTTGGSWTATGLREGTYRLDFSATGYVSTAVVSQLLTLPSTVVEPVPLVPSSPVPGGISGSLLNATSNAAIVSSVTVELRSGMNALTGTTVASQTTSTGTYQFTSVAAGVYTVLARGSGFADGSRTGIVVGAGTTRTGQDVLLSPSAGGSSARIVLSWGPTPPDIDSHLSGPVTGQTGRFWVYFDSKGSCTVAPFACLDIDDVDGYGPETMTISQVKPGVYRYYVYDYTYRGSPTSTALGQSGAKVQLYVGSNLLQTFFVPQGAGNAWAVFEWDGHAVTVVNRLYAISGVPQPALRSVRQAETAFEAEMRQQLQSLPPKKR